MAFISDSGSSAEDISFNVNALHQKAQQLRNIVGQNSATYNQDWQQAQNYHQQLVSEMYGPLTSFADLWHSQVQALYQLHEGTAQGLDNAATSFGTTETSIAKSFQATNGPNASGPR